MASRLPAVCCAANGNRIAGLGQHRSAGSEKTQATACVGRRCSIRWSLRRRSLLMVSTGQGRQPDTTIYLIVHPGHDTHAFLVRVAQLDTRNDTESHKA